MIAEGVTLAQTGLAAAIEMISEAEIRGKKLKCNGRSLTSDRDLVTVFPVRQKMIR